MNFTLKFGGGVNSAASEDDVAINECVVGENFSLDYKNKNLKPRKSIKLVGTAPNASQINGFVNHVNNEGVSTILIQAGGDVYQWSSEIGFILKSTISSSAKIRGHHHQNYWALDDFVLVSDLSLIEPVMKWDSSAITDMSHNLTGDFKAKYIYIDNERAHYSNVISNSVATPHMMVVSKLSDNENLSISDRPSSSLGADDPFYILTPDLRPINAMIGYFDTIVVSSQRGSLFKVSGSDSTDTSILPLFPMSYATGIEPMVNTGNDVIYGRAGRIESVSTSDTYGDISTDDLSAPIKNDIATYSDWMSAYNSTTQKIYYYPIGSNHLWQYSKDKVDETSSWVKLTTNAPFNMAITAMMSMIDPVNNVEYTFIGDTNGKVYILEGDDGGLDAGQNSVETFWRSGVLKLPNMYKASGFDGYISYRATEDTIITVKFIFGGSNSSISTHEVALKGASGGFYFGGDVYFGEEGVYFGSEFSGSFKRESIIPSGESEEIQIEISHNAEASFEINELGIRFTGQTSP